MRMRGIYLASRAISVSDSELDLSVSFIKGFSSLRPCFVRECGRERGRALVVVLMVVVVAGKLEIRHKIY